MNKHNEDAYEEEEEDCSEEERFPIRDLIREKAKRGYIPKDSKSRPKPGKEYQILESKMKKPPNPNLFRNFSTGRLNSDVNTTGTCINEYSMLINQHELNANDSRNISRLGKNEHMELPISAKNVQGLKSYTAFGRKRVIHKSSDVLLEAIDKTQFTNQSKEPEKKEVVEVKKKQKKHTGEDRSNNQNKHQRVRVDRNSRDINGNENTLNWRVIETEKLPVRQDLGKIDLTERYCIEVKRHLITRTYGENSFTKEKEKKNNNYYNESNKLDEVNERNKILRKEKDSHKLTNENNERKNKIERLRDLEQKIKNSPVQVRNSPLNRQYSNRNRTRKHDLYDAFDEDQSHKEYDKRDRVKEIEHIPNNIHTYESPKVISKEKSKKSSPHQVDFQTKNQKQDTILSKKLKHKPKDQQFNFKIKIPNNLPSEELNCNIHLHNFQNLYENREKAKENKNDEIYMEDYYEEREIEGPEQETSYPNFSRTAAPFYEKQATKVKISDVLPDHIPVSTFFEKRINRKENKPLANKNNTVTGETRFDNFNLDYAERPEQRTFVLERPGISKPDTSSFETENEIKDKIRHLRLKLKKENIKREENFTLNEYEAQLAKMSFIKNSSDFFKNNKFININNFFTSTFENQNFLNENDRNQQTQHVKRANQNSKTPVKAIEKRDNDFENIYRANNESSFICETNTINPNKHAFDSVFPGKQNNVSKKKQLFKPSSGEKLSHEQEFIQKLIEIFSIYYNDIYDEKCFSNKDNNIRFFNQHLKTFIEKHSLANQIQNNVSHLLHDATNNDPDTFNKIVLVLKNMLVSNQYVKPSVSSAYNNPNLLNHTSNNFEHQYRLIKENSFTYKKQKEELNKRKEREKEREREKTPTIASLKKKEIETIVLSKIISNQSQNNNQRKGQESSYNIFNSKIKFDESSKFFQATIKKR